MSNIISMRFSDDEIKKIDRLAKKKKCESPGEFCKLLILSNLNADIKRPKVLRMPQGDGRALRLYSAMLEEIDGRENQNPRISMAQILKQLQFRAAIRGYNTLLKTLEILIAQKFIVDRDDFYVVMQNWEEER